MKTGPKATLALAAILTFAFVQSPQAHEFWIDVGADIVEIGDTLSAHLRVGQDLSGSSIPYLDSTMKSMKLHAPGGTQAIEARLGDRPAIADLPIVDEGLHILTVETNPSYIEFDTMYEFEDYLDYEGLGHIVEAHGERALPDTDIAEAYIRNARALIQIGAPTAHESDRRTGLPFEIRVDGSPFDPDVTELSVVLEWRGEPLADAQIAMFHAPIGANAPQDTVRTLARTGEHGRGRFRIAAAGDYMFNAVYMAPVEGPGSVVWESHWASLTFVRNEPQK
ncbi:DUF4198 domain-containing protein [Sulfitobacter aestuariivivens]|uniref:DUF4198 domain-containing protein n=1 Tax=Sulfitobacter aestuariivivens TaxID=2766981 RepID=A0A927D1E7_9RHOB|nr:DUF4198 domain-containing protein [Sulfitobacter aestuariivivens]MBD3662593.1 DUF4198 domain-containing protein [Sulfitobacter aestuariivivens]